MRAKSNIICPPAHNLSLLYFTKCLKPSLNYWIQLQEMHNVVDQVSSTDVRFRYWNYCYFMLCYIHGFQTCNLMLLLKSVYSIANDIHAKVSGQKFEIISYCLPFLGGSIFYHWIRYRHGLFMKNPGSNW